LTHETLPWWKPSRYSHGEPEQPTHGSTSSAKITRYESEYISIDAAPVRNALLVLGEKYYQGWRATVDGKNAEIYPVNYVLRGFTCNRGLTGIEFFFDPLPFKIGKWLTLVSFAFFARCGAGMWIRQTRREG